jgi:methanogenic corrinoid protein MtbC1
MTMEILEAIKTNVVKGEPVLGLVEEALRSYRAEDILNQAVVPGVLEAGRLWEEGEYFLPDIIFVTDSFKEVFGVLREKKPKGDESIIGKYLIGVVQGDMHDLGKSLVIAILSAGGFEVIDLGFDVPIQTFVEKVREIKPDILGIGAYMSTTMLIIRDVIEALRSAGLRGGLKIMAGGAPITSQFAIDLGADGYGRDAMEALKNARQLMGVES